MAKSIPANELTNEDFRNWVIKESVGHESGAHIVVPSADQAYDQYDMCVAEPWCGIVDRAAANAAELTMLVTEGIQIDTAEIESGSTFANFGDEVWYNTTTKEYSDTDTAGYFLVGYVVLPLNSDSVMRFEKTRYAVESELT
jgi:hypothetical protein